MKKNIGNSDKLIRLGVVAILVGLYFGDFLPKTVGIISLVVAGIVVFTIVSGFCPLYILLGIKTCPTKK